MIVSRGEVDLIHSGMGLLQAFFHAADADHRGLAQNIGGHNSVCFQEIERCCRWLGFILDFD